MTNEETIPRKQCFARWMKRSVALFLAFLMLLGAGPLEALAAWDGSGSSGSGNSQTVTGGYSLPNAGPKDIMGYRFTVYDEFGNKQGHSIDIDFLSKPKAPQRSSGDSKQSHIDLYRAYLDFKKDEKDTNPIISFSFQQFGSHLFTPQSPCEIFLQFPIAIICNLCYNFVTNSFHK